MKRHNLILVSGSVHDVYIRLDDGKKSDAFYLNKQNTLNTVNIESDILTRNVFRYDRNTNEIKVI